MAPELNRGSGESWVLRITYAAMGVVFLLGLLSSASGSLFPSSLNAIAGLTTAHLRELIAMLLMAGAGWVLTERRNTENPLRRAILMLTAIAGAVSLACIIAEVMNPQFAATRTPLTIFGYGFALLLLLAFATQQQS